MASTLAPDFKKHTNYEYQFDLKGDSSAAAIVRFVADGSKVLDLGAGSGSITRVLAGQKRCTVTAVENNPAAVAKLKGFCHAVVLLDLNDEAWASQLEAARAAAGDEARYDYVVAGDVLEHLYDPWTTARNMARLLKPEGKVVISVPHGGHSVVVAAYLNSDIDWQESGILDKTHIRLFGLRNIDVLHDHAGLAITRVHYVMRPPAVTEFAAAWAALPEETRKVLAQRSCADVYQVVTEAALKPRVSQPLRLAGDEAGRAAARRPGLVARLLGRA